MPAESLAAVLERYVILLYHWNRRVRLVGERDPAEFRRNHLAEVTSALPLLAGRPWDTAVDIGSGNGLLAVPLAAAHPTRTVIALEPRQRKCAFLRRAALELVLPNLSVRQETLQDFCPPHGAALLWTARSLEIPTDVFLTELVRHPDALLLLFSGPGAPSHRLIEPGADRLRLLDRLEFGPPSGRKAVLMEVSGGCFT
jgi:16S rRNA G527 N7-methylase RsmG